MDGKEQEADTEMWRVDGKDHDNRGPGGNTYTVKMERIGERHIRLTVKGPKGTTVSNLTVSTDGKNMTTIRTGTGSTSGRPINETLAYTKQ